MFEVTDVVIAGITSSAISLIQYLSIKKIRNSQSTDLTDKQKRKQQSFVQRELWEHAANTSALGIALFLFFVFNTATDMSQYPFLPRLVVSLVCLVAVIFILRTTTRALFRYCRNRLVKV